MFNNLITMMMSVKKWNNNVDDNNHKDNNNNINYTLCTLYTLLYIKEIVEHIYKVKRIYVYKEIQQMLYKCQTRNIIFCRESDLSFFKLYIQEVFTIPKKLKVRFIEFQNFVHQTFGHIFIVLKIILVKWFCQSLCFVFCVKLDILWVSNIM